MRISVVGTGYVGLVTGTCFAEKGNEVTLVDVVKEKVEKINQGKPTIFEEGLEKMLKRNKKRIRATTDLKDAVMNTDITFVCVGTPSRKDGSIDLKYIKQASRQIGKVLKEKKDYHVVVIKSTVVPGTSENVVIPILEEESGEGPDNGFGMCMNPEFLKEGRALDDFMNPDRIVIGQHNHKAGDVVEKLYKGFDAPVLRVDLNTAEMIKYAANTFLAGRISLINEIGNVCKQLGINVYDVAEGIGYDKRIGPRFLNAGVGFGGSCFPKDVKALVAKAREAGVKPRIMESILKVNSRQPVVMVKLLKDIYHHLNDKTVAVLGLAFKPGTDDIRESPALRVVKTLLKERAKVQAHDPKAMENFRKEVPDAEYFDTPEKALKGAHACLILTDWPEYGKLEDRDFDLMENKVIIEGRRILDREKIDASEGICW